MDTTRLALLALLAGIVIGGSIAAVIVTSLRARDRARGETSLAIPEGVREVLHGMDDAAVVVDASFTVLAASAAAGPFNFVEGRSVPDDQLRGVARAARSESSPATETMRLRRGAPPAEPRLVVDREQHRGQLALAVVLRDLGRGRLRRVPAEVLRRRRQDLAGDGILLLALVALGVHVHVERNQRREVDAHPMRMSFLLTNSSMP